MAQLSGTSNTSATSVNLETDGTTHWIHWLQDGTVIRKNTGASSSISTFSKVGTFTEAGYNNDPRSITWTNGTPTASGTDNDGLYSGGTASSGIGFSFTLDADTSVRTAKFHFGLFSSSGTFSASLSDGSATMSDIAASDPGVNTSGDFNVTLTFQAASGGQTCTVNWVIGTASVSYGNVTINGISLSVAAASTSDTISNVIVKRLTNSLVIF